MARYVCILAVVFLQIFIAWGNDSKEKVDCSKTTCKDYTVKDIVKKMWDIPKHSTQTPLTAHFRHSVLDAMSEIHHVPRMMPRLMALTILSINILTKATQCPNAPDITCILPNLIKVDMARDDHDRNITEYKLAVDNYRILLANDLSHAKYLSLSMVGCPAEKNEAVEKKTCRCSRNMLEDSLDDDDTFTQKLKDSIVALVRSDNKSDRILSVAALASRTQVSTKVMSRLVQSEHFMNMYSLNSCVDDKIEPECCSLREGLLNEAREGLLAELDVIFKQVVEEETTV